MSKPDAPADSPGSADDETVILHEARDSAAARARGDLEELPPGLPVIGTQFGGEDDRRFDLLGLLGRGAMGAVYLARDQVLDRTVAVKFISSKPDASREDVAALIRQEARATARLNHENIMRVFDLDTYHGMPVIVMELLEGQALSAMVEQGSVDALRAARLMADVARGLSHAHRIGIVHRDLKPGNIFIVKDGRAKICDFGLATILRAHGGAARPGRATQSSSSVAGTPRYMSPEQWRGESLDGRTDLWALGVIFYELLAGRPPVDAQEFSRIRECVISPEPLPSIRQFRPDLPAAADRLIARALAKDVNQRFSTADELLDALVALEVALSPSLRAAPQEAGAARTRPRPTQRQMSLMSCGIANLASLAEQLDPETYSDLLASFFEIGSTVVRQLEGTVASAVGGRLLACFGYPVAHEDDAQRAVRAALLVSDAMRQSGRHSSLASGLRIGIHTGPVIVAATQDPGESIVLQGGAPEVATWLEQRAAPGTIAASSTTSTLTRGMFELTPLGAQTPEGASRPIEIFRVVGQRQETSRFEQATMAGLTPLVGRDDEMAKLRALWSRAVGGEGQYVLISGEAGIGKSRLIESLKDDVIEASGAKLTGQCWAYFKHAAFHPLIDAAHRAIGIAPGDAAADKLAKLTAVLESLKLDVAEYAPLLANLLSIPTGTAFPALNLSPDVFRLRLIDSLSTILIRIAADRPTLIVIEDVHWTDASTEELLAVLLDRIATTRMLVAITFRPEYRHPFPVRAHLHHIQLARLPLDATAAMVSYASRGRNLPPDITATLVERTDGVPLFVEELTRMVIESWNPVARAAQSAASSALVSSIPATLNELLLARLDRLAGAGKEVAQLGAVLGREFPFTLIERVSHLDEDQLRSGLRQLVEAGLLRYQESGSGARYVFKHALVQETAYRSLPASGRRDHHLRVADTLCRDVPEMAEQQPELVAYHFAEAGAAVQALPHLEKAGARAVQRSAHTDAITHYRRAIDLLATVDDNPERARKELLLRLALGSPLMAVKGYANPEVETNYARALELCRGLGDDSQIFPATLGLWQFSMVGGQIAISVLLGRQLLAQAEAARNPTSTMLALRALGTSCMLAGDLVAAREYTTRGLTLYDQEQHGTLAFRFGHDPGVAHGLYRGLTLWLLGYADQALRAMHDALGLARDLKHPVSIAFALCYLGVVEILRGEYTSAREHANEAAALGAEHRLALWAAMSRIVDGWARAGLDSTGDGAELLREGIEAWQRTGAGAGIIFHAAHAWALLRAGRHAEALSVLQASEAIQDKNGELFFQPELLRLRGEALRAETSAGTPEIEALFRRSLEIARDEHARALELRTGLSLARLLVADHRATEALETLRPIHAWFAEGLDTRDLVEAKRMLEALRGE